MDDDLPEPARRDRCSASLTGLSVGDALGAACFGSRHRMSDLGAGRLPAAPWAWTDDTQMACSVVAQLWEIGHIEQDALAAAFAQRYERRRDYGPGATDLLRRVRDGTPWRTATAELFGGQGSWGNGGAMRVAPLGAYFADDPARAAREAARSAEVTHAHPEGIAGAAAVAVAAAHAADAYLRGIPPDPGAFLTRLLDHVGHGQVAQGIRRGVDLLDRTVAEAARELGNGSQISAPDTVPFCAWVAATHLDDYPTAVTACIQAGGDTDTTAAITGGIVAAYTGTGERSGVRGVPAAWVEAREPLPDWMA